MTSSNLKKLQDLLKDGGGGGDGGSGDGSGSFSGTVATSTDSGFFTPTYGGDRSKKKVESFVKELLEWVSNELKKEDNKLKTPMPPQNQGDEPKTAIEISKALIPPATSRKHSSEIGAKENAVLSSSREDVHPKTATESINAGTDNLDLLRKFEDQDKKEMSQKVGIFNDQNQVLILRDAYSDWWDLPGGRMHYDETFLEALQREVYEETKLPIKNIKFVTSSNEKLGNQMKLVLIYSANAEFNLVPQLSEEHRGFEWITEDQIDIYNLGVFKPILRFLFHNKREAIQKAEEWVMDTNWDPRPLNKPDVVSGGPKKPLTSIRASEDPSFLAPTDHQHFVPNALKVHDFHLVGGAVRDKLLGKPHSDFDVVTHTPLQQVKEHLELNNIPHHQTNTGGKSLTYQHNGNFVDVASTEGKSIIDDLARRDFTINSMAEGPDSKLIDPFGGQQDLQNKVLRSPNNDSHSVFNEDPVRMLRAARFVGDLDLTPDASVIDAIKLHGPKLAEMPTERVGKEFSKLMTSANPTKGLEFLREHGLLQHISPELHATVGFEQKTPHHRLDVWGHALETIHHMKSNDLVANLAALFHDIGKPGTADEAKATFHGHDEAGAQIAKKTLQRLHFPEDTVNRVVRLVDNHMRIHNLPEDAKDAAYNRLRHQMGDDLPLLVDLTRADAMAGSNRDLGYIDRFQTRLGRIKPLPERKDLSPLTGQEIMEHMGLKPGPEIGRFKNLLHDKVIEGELSADDKESAKKLLDLNKADMKQYLEVGQKPPHNEPIMTGPKGGKFYYATFYNQEPKDAINKWFGREDAADLLTIAFGTSKEGISTRITDAGQDPVYPNLFAVEATIHNSPGAKIGHMYRRFIKETNSAYHTSFMLNPKYQGQGIGSDILENTEQAYQRLGLSHISLYANEDVGGYAWALQGFDFQDSATLQNVRQFASLVSNALRTRNFKNLKDQGYEDVSDFADQRINHDDLDIMDDMIPKSKHAWEFAMLNPSKAPHGQHLGKLIMMNTGWFGRKLLDKDSLSWKIGEAYRSAKRSAKFSGG